eukprot:CAMPEP_0196783436 /NCGR_PEP_ID=MMETSP1104-20130614/13685_1 /TAXON_ID=33652 /ORGANISM="Cafeteria sp., Strain Caron Lab Isolate" /LENGTH=41 /DNA_ID= /DNA_START= /DNA_END= /DNA_ORIENTATION=
MAGGVMPGVPPAVHLSMPAMPHPSVGSAVAAGQAPLGAMHG